MKLADPDDSWCCPVCGTLNRIADGDFSAAGFCQGVRCATLRADFVHATGSRGTPEILHACRKEIVAA